MPLEQIIGGEDGSVGSLIWNRPTKSSEPLWLMERGDHIPKPQGPLHRLDCKSQA